MRGKSQLNSFTFDEAKTSQLPSRQFAELLQSPPFFFLFFFSSYLSGFWKFNVSRVEQQNLLANGAFQNKLERCTVEALERPVKPADEQEVMNSSDDTCSFPFLLCNELKN